MSNGHGSARRAQGYNFNGSEGGGNQEFLIEDQNSTRVKVVDNWLDPEQRSELSSAKNTGHHHLGSIG